MTLQEDKIDYLDALWKYWPDEEGAVTYSNLVYSIFDLCGNTGLMKKVL